MDTENRDVNTDSRGTKRSLNPIDIEDCGHKRHKGQTILPIVTSYTQSPSQRSQRTKSWRETLGPPPTRGTTRVII